MHIQRIRTIGSPCDCCDFSLTFSTGQMPCTAWVCNSDDDDRVHTIHPRDTRHDRHPRSGRRSVWRAYAQPAVPTGRRARLRQDDFGGAVFDGGRAVRRARPVRDALGKRRRAARRGRVPRLVARRDHDPRAGTVRRQLAAGRSVHHVPPVGDRTRRDHQDHSGRRGTGQAGARGVRFALGAAAAGGQSAPVSAADPRAQAVLQRTQMHGASAGRHDQHGPRPAGAEHRPRRGAAGANVPRVRRGTATPDRAEVSRPPVSGRVSRLRRAGGWCFRS